VEQVVQGGRCSLGIVQQSPRNEASTGLVEHIQPRTSSRMLRQIREGREGKPRHGLPPLLVLLDLLCTFMGKGGRRRWRRQRRRRRRTLQVYGRPRVTHGEFLRGRRLLLCNLLRHPASVTVVVTAVVVLVVCGLRWRSRCTAWTCRLLRVLPLRSGCARLSNLGSVVVL
jgi:hypothetical protein